ncbi:unnamed protein product [Closterium sp. NIES-65]|nr:unnamed protein product [Closterium sp. NIES-65]
MYPADCVIGNLRGSSVGAYYISGLSRSQIDGGAAPASVAATSPPGLSLVKEECFLDVSETLFFHVRLKSQLASVTETSPPGLSLSLSSRLLSSSTPLPPFPPDLSPPQPLSLPPTLFCLQVLSIRRGRKGSTSPLNQEETEGLCQRASVAASSSGLFPFPSPPTHPPPPICRFSRSEGNEGRYQFSRSEGDGGAVPVSFNGSNSLNWAFSDSGSTELAFHGNNA